MAHKAHELVLAGDGFSELAHLSQTLRREGDWNAEPGGMVAEYIRLQALWQLNERTSATRA